MKNATGPTCCPWCSSKEPPLYTRNHLDVAIFRYLGGNYSTPEKGAKVNPAMCPDCFGVGGWEDWESAE